MFISSFRRFLKELRSPARRRPIRTRARGGRTLRPWFEALEDRILLSTVNWIGGSGDWADASHWTDGSVNRLPAANDDVVINVAGVTVTHSQTDAIKSLTASDPISLSGGILTVTGMLQDSSPLALSGGTLSKATVVAGTTITATSGTLDGLTLGATVGGVAQTATVDEPSGSVVITGGLTFVNGSVYQLGSDSFVGSIQFQGDETVGGSGEFRCEGISGGSMNSFNNLLI
jgi:hypothetical protein